MYPPAWKGPKQEPAFTGLKEAYLGSGHGDWAVVSERKVQAGDIILVHGGLYKGDRFNYSDALGLDFDGTYVLTAKGTPERPIVIRAAGDGEVIFDGDGAHELFNVMAADYHIFEGLTIRKADIAFQAGLEGRARRKRPHGPRTAAWRTSASASMRSTPARRISTSPTMSSSDATTATGC